jgi:CO dehydrogenase/acetyl-CoA synthase beta subunit
LELIEGPKLDDSDLIEILEEIEKYNTEIDSQVSSDIAEFLDKNHEFALSLSSENNTDEETEVSETETNQPTDFVFKAPLSFLETIDSAYLYDAVKHLFSIPPIRSLSTLELRG